MATAVQSISNLNSNLSQWAGLRKSAGSSSCSVKAAVPKFSKFVVKASTEGVDAQAAISQSQPEALFASVSTSTSPAPGVPPVALVSAGAIVGAAGFYAATRFLGGSEEIVEVVEEAAPAAPANGAAFVKRAAPAALASISHYFPNAMQDESFVRAVARELFSLGFSRDNCIALVNTCRDEVCRPLATFIDQQFGLSFNIAGLGGLINCGKTGFKAGMSHSPVFPCDSNGKPRERYVFFAFPHVSIGESGEVGSLLRRGRGKPSSACGALIAIQNDIKAGSSAGEDKDDAEYIQLKKKIYTRPICQNCGPAGPSLVDVTKAALQVITADLEDLISKTVNPETADYAVVTGVQIHSGNQVPGEPFSLDRTVDYVAPGTMYAVIRGEKYILHCEVNEITKIKSLAADLVSA